jgi:hypothetical protein
MVTAGGATSVVNGSTLQMIATVLPTDAANRTVTWSVAAVTGAATIDASTGLLTGTAVGAVIVTASATDGSGVTGSETITVISANTPAPAGGGGGGVSSPGPAVTSVSPNTGSMTGGAAVIVTGDNIASATAVTFGAMAASSFTVNSNGTIAATPPAEAVGTVNVFVTTPAGVSPVSLSDQFTYTAPAPVPAQGFSDVPPSYWASDAINSLSSLGYAGGYPDGSFRPGNKITRAEFATIMDNVLKLTNHPARTPVFSDASTDAWFYQAVETAVYAGIFKGYGDGTFHPDAPISRQEIGCVLIQALEESQLADSNANAVTRFIDDHDIAWWSRGYAFVALRQGIIGGYPDGSFKPENETTRAEACAMVERFLSVRR